MMILGYVFMILFILIGVAFFTLMERKILGYIHYRLGPNKLGIIGMLQPFSDALKLFTKSNMKFLNLNYNFYMMSPCLGIFLMMMIWSIYSFWGNLYYSNMSMIFFILISSLSIYFLLGTGWSSFSKYSLMGSYRSVSQAISYEISMFLLLLLFCWFLNSYSLMTFSLVMWMNNFFIWNFPLILIWMLICLAETNRTPFDFSEGESELVSGFNTEYGGGFFSLIFISEYGSIIFLSFITVMVFLSNSILMSLKAFLICFLFVWIRGSYPRLRYDKLMMMAWKSVLPVVLGWMIFIFNYSF